MVAQGFSTVAVDDTTAIYDSEGGSLVMLNVSASALWKRCDGRSTFDQIVNDVVAQYKAEDVSLDKDVVREDLWQTLVQLRALGLVTDVTDADGR